MPIRPRTLRSNAKLTTPHEASCLRNRGHWLHKDHAPLSRLPPFGADTGLPEFAWCDPRAITRFYPAWHSRVRCGDGAFPEGREDRSPRTPRNENARKESIPMFNDLTTEGAASEE